MSYIDILSLGNTYFRHDDRELWDSEPLGCVPRFTHLRFIAKASRGVKYAPLQSWWPASRIYGDSALSEDVTMPPALWDDKVEFNGNSGYPYRIYGFALDSVGAGVANAEIQLFRYSDKAYLRSIFTMDASGQYDHGTDDNTTQHFIRSQRTSPDIVGTTVATLTGS